MPSTDKISLMTAAVGGDLAGSTTRIEVTTLYTTVPATLGCTLALLRTTMFAGGSGYTATDPLVVGNITAGASMFVVTAATGAVSQKGATTITQAFNQYHLNFASTGTVVTGGVYVGANSINGLHFITTSNHGLGFAVNNGAPSFTIANTGAATFASTLAVTGASTLTGVVAIGAATQAGIALYVAPAGTLTTTDQRGGFFAPTFSSASTSSAYAISAYVVTAAASFTVSNAQALNVAAPSLGATSAITDLYGIRIYNQGVAGVTNAYGVHIAAQSGAATTNIGLYNAGTTTLVGAVSIGATTTQTAGTYISAALEFRLGARSFSRVATDDGGGGFVSGYNQNYATGVKVDSNGSTAAIHYTSGLVKVFANSSLSAGDAALEVARFTGAATAATSVFAVYGTSTLTGNVGIGEASTATSLFHLKKASVPTSAAGLAAGDVWANSGVLTMV